MDSRQQILSPIFAEFDEFQKRFSSLFSSSNEAVDVLLKFLSRRSGKQMRPILVLLVSKCFGSVPDSAYHLASSLELLHQGSLIHDDVVDESEKRRGLRSANAAFDNKMAVLLGDYVVSMALLEITATSNPVCVESISKLIGTLSQGEICQLNALESSNLSEQVYFDIISHKTAALFSCCTYLAAILSGATESQAEAFRQFGEVAGLCFQIMDDILDYHDTIQTGKPSGNDLKEGKFTLPAIYALTHSDKDWSASIKAVRSLCATSDQIKEITDYTTINGGIDYAISKMENLKRTALCGLPEIVNPELRNAFTSYLDLISNRVR